MRYFVPQTKPPRGRFRSGWRSDLSITTLVKSGRPDSNRRRPAWEAGILPTELHPRIAEISSLSSAESQRSGLNRRPLDYESSALPLSYAGDTSTFSLCPDADSNRDALRHHPLKMACLPISPPGQLFLRAGLTGLEPATSGVTDRHSNQLSYSPQKDPASCVQFIAPRGIEPLSAP